MNDTGNSGGQNQRPKPGRDQIRSRLHASIQAAAHLADDPGPETIDRELRQIMRHDNGGGTVTAYPNKEHGNADKAATRRALQALADIEREVALLRKRVESGTADGDHTSTLAERTADVTRQLAFLEALRRARGWHAADSKEAGR